jgi:cation transport ATPase
MDISNVANLANPEAAILESKNIAVEGLDGEAFARRIEEALRAQPGVKEVRLEKARGILSITFDTRQTNFPDLHDLILKSGYRPSRSIEE